MQSVVKETLGVQSVVKETLGVQSVVKAKSPVTSYKVDNIFDFFHCS